MKTALLIATYNWTKALDLVLKTVVLQTVFPDEILIADDGSTEDTVHLIKQWRQKMSIPINHLWHEDKGFRKTIILNKAIASSKADYIIQIDGDILLEKHFIQDHIKAARKGFYIKGSRSLLSEERTAKIIESGKFDVKIESRYAKNRINATRFPLIAPVFRKDKLTSNNVKGCNFSFWKKDFVAVNGYNNDMNGWGHEDVELAGRLTNIGVKQRQLKMVAVCFHLYHSFNDRINENINYEKYLEVVRNKIIRCEDGYEQ